MLAETGMRVGELHSLTWGDVDEAGSRFRVKAGKSAAARRWVAVPENVMSEVAEMCQREDRTSERRVFAGFTPDVAKNIMARAARPPASSTAIRMTFGIGMRRCRSLEACR